MNFNTLKNVPSAIFLQSAPARARNSAIATVILLFLAFKGTFINKIFKLSLFFICLLLLTGCGTLLYKPDEAVIKSMSFQEAKEMTESLFVQIVPRGSLQVYEDRLDISTPLRRVNCYFNSMPIEIKDYGSLAGGGEYPIGSRYSVSVGSGQGCGYIMFKDYEVAKTFANAVYVLKNTPRQAKESFFQTLKQRTITPPAINLDTVTIPQVISDTDKTPF